MITPSALQNGPSKKPIWPTPDYLAATQFFESEFERNGTLVGVSDTAERKRVADMNKKSNNVLEKLQKNTTWLQNVNGQVDVAVQTQARILSSL